MHDPSALVLLALMLLAGLGCAGTPAPDAEPRGFLARSVALNGQKHPYVVYVPESLDLSRPVPLVLFLHGKGECGTDNTAQLRVGLAPAVLAHPGRWPCLILMPQKPDAEKQWEDYDAMVMAQLSDVKNRYRIDPDRVYLTGLSQGGHGTWTLGALHPHLWATLAPICGYGDPGPVVPKIKDIPVWAFHGGKDDIIEPAQSAAMVDALIKAGSTHAMLTVFPEANHNSWDKAYGEPDLAVWLLDRRRGRS